jgi:hypothetical protein
MMMDGGRCDDLRIMSIPANGDPGTLSLPESYQYFDATKYLIRHLDAYYVRVNGFLI